MKRSAQKIYLALGFTMSILMQSCFNAMAPSTLPEPSFNYGTLVDARDGQTYKTIQIGTQIWMAQNLNYGIQLSGDSNQTNSKGTQKYCYNNDVGNCNKFGGLYQFHTAIGVPLSCDLKYSVSKSCLTSGVIQGICPSGWHLPSDSEYATLKAFPLNHMQVYALEATSDGYGATDSTGFGILYAGVRNPDGTFTNAYLPSTPLEMGFSAILWPSSTDTAGIPVSITALNGFLYLQIIADSAIATPYDGASVRCIKD